MALSHGTVQYLGGVRDLSPLADNEADGVREGFVMRGCPAPDSASQHFLAETLYALHATFAECHRKEKKKKVGQYCSGSSSDSGHLLPPNPTPKPKLTNNPSGLGRPSAHPPRMLPRSSEKLHRYRPLV